MIDKSLLMDGALIDGINGIINELNKKYGPINDHKPDKSKILFDAFKQTRSNGNFFVFKINIPGFSLDNIDVRIENSYLIVYLQVFDNYEETKNEYVFKSRPSFNAKNIIGHLDSNILDLNCIQSIYKDGVLEVAIPYKDNNIKISIKKG